MTAALRRLKAAVPVTVKDRAKRAMGRRTALDGLTGTGCTLDLYFWLVEGTIDTIVPVANYFSVLFPDLDTATTATLTLLDRHGAVRGHHRLEVGHMATPSVRVSTLLREMAPDLLRDDDCFGSLTWHLVAPPAVVARIDAMGEAFLFWDRSYIGYTGADQQAAFVHGVDKTDIVLADGRTVPWPMGARDSFNSSPELPVCVDDYYCLDVILQNRSARERTVTLTVTDVAGGVVRRSVAVPSRGVHRVTLDRPALAQLDATEPLRLRVDGLPTRYGRPIVLKHFESGAFSLMHC